MRKRRHIIFSPLLILATTMICLAVAATIADVTYKAYKAQSVANLYIRDDQPPAILPPIHSESLASESAQLNATSGAQTATVHVPILMYHYIEHVKDKKDTFRQKLNIYPEVLDSQIKTMQQHGYTFITASELSDIIDHKRDLPPKPVVLTFDDGYRDFYTDAFPIIKKYNVYVTAYIISGVLGKPNYMYESQLKEVEQSGLVEIGAHTVHHIDLQRATDVQAEEEIDQSKSDLENLLHITVTSFAYPGGRFNSKTADFVKAAGFTNAVSTMPGSSVTTDTRYVLFRLRPGSRTGSDLLNFLERFSH